jgi:hypothetical protein
MRYLAYVATRYRAGEFFDWAVVLRENQKMIGTCGFTSFSYEHNSAEIGYVLNPSYWGQGIALEAVQAVMYFIDDAVMVGAGTVRILHGTGTGALRQAIRQYLSTVASVKSFRDEHIQLGGVGITVVELDD